MTRTPTAIATSTVRMLAANGDISALIVATARAIINAEGLERLSLEEVAETAGIDLDTLTSRFPDRCALAAAVRESLFRELAFELQRAEADASPHEALLRMGKAYRTFASRNGNIYKRVTPSGEDASSAALQLLWPIIDAFRRFVGAERALLGTRTLVSFLHGFAVMEANDNFQLNGSIDDAFNFGLHAVIDGVRAQSGTQPSFVTG